MPSNEQIRNGMKDAFAYMTVYLDSKDNPAGRPNAHLEMQEILDESDAMYGVGPGLATLFTMFAEDAYTLLPRKPGDKREPRELFREWLQEHAKFNATHNPAEPM